MKIPNSNIAPAQINDALPRTGFVRLNSILAPARPDPGRPFHMVAGRQDRALSQADKTRSADDRLEGRGYPQSHREGGIGGGEAVRLPPRQNPSQLHDQ